MLSEVRPERGVALRPRGLCSGKHDVARLGHRSVSHAIPPKDGIEHIGVCPVSMGEIHPGGLPRARGVGRVHRVDQSILPISSVGGEGRLVTSSRKERRHDGRLSIIVVHRGQI